MHTRTRTQESRAPGGRKVVAARTARGLEAPSEPSAGGGRPCGSSWLCEAGLDSREGTKL